MPDENTILVVDGDPATHQVLNATSACRRWRIENAPNAAEALELLRARPYGVVIDGIDLMRQVRQVRPEIPVVILTSDGTPRDVIRSIRERAFSYFSKPFSTNALTDMVTQALEARAWQDDIEVYSALPEWIELDVRCKLQTADRLAQFMMELKMDLPARDREQIGAAFRELLMNAIEHGGHSDPGKRVFVAFMRTSRALVYYIRDPGEGFSMSDLTHAAISNPEDTPARHLETRMERGIRPGGFGILLARNLVDELIYNEKGNAVLFIKYLEGGRPRLQHVRE